MAVIQWLLLPFILVCSGCISGTETALFGLTRGELRSFGKSTHRFRRLAHSLMQRPRRVLITILIVNTAVNVLFFSVSFVTLEKLGRSHPLVATAGGILSLLCVILFGEILPKAAARSRAAKLAPLAAPIVEILSKILTPITFVLSFLLITPLTRLLQAGPGTERVGVRQLRSLVDISANQGLINESEKRMLHSVVGLSRIKAREVMQPRVDIETVSILASREELLETLRTAHYTTIPVTGADRDDVRGLIYARDVFLNASVPWTVLIRPARFVPEQVNLLQLMHHFQGHSTKLAIVVDEYGGVAGVVSLQDVLEQIVGDLAGASQPAEPAITEIDQEAFSVSGDASLREWIERSGLAEIEIDLEGVRFHTVAGLVLAKLGRLPTEGDTVRIGPFDLIVKKMNGRRIHRILTRRLPDETNDRPQAGEDGSEQPQ